MHLDALAFAAHPDDIELGCSGTLIKLVDLGYSIGVITLTQGEMGTRGSAEIRKREFNKAAEIMGLSVAKMLDIPDGRVEVSWENKLKVIREIREYRPRIIFLPYWKVRHPDHGHASQLVREAAFLSGLKKIDTNQEHHRPLKLLFYPCRFEFTPTFIVDISDYFDKKVQSIQAYESQFYHPGKDADQEETFISSPEFLEMIITRAKYHGSQIGVSYGEPFLVREAIEVHDPVAFFAGAHSKLPP